MNTYSLNFKSEADIFRMQVLINNPASYLHVSQKIQLDNVCHAENRTKRSSNILLWLVRFSA